MAADKLAAGFCCVCALVPEASATPLAALLHSKRKRKRAQEAAALYEIGLAAGGSERISEQTNSSGAGCDLSATSCLP